MNQEIFDMFIGTKHFFRNKELEYNSNPFSKKYLIVESKEFLSLNPYTLVEIEKIENVIDTLSVVCKILSGDLKDKTVLIQLKVDKSFKELMDSIFIPFGNTDLFGKVYQFTEKVKKSDLMSIPDDIINSSLKFVNVNVIDRRFYYESVVTEFQFDVLDENNYKISEYVFSSDFLPSSPDEFKCYFNKLFLKVS